MALDAPVASRYAYSSGVKMVEADVLYGCRDLGVNILLICTELPQP